MKLGSSDSSRIATQANSGDGMALSDTASMEELLSGDAIPLFHCLFHIFKCTSVRVHPPFLSRPVMPYTSQLCSHPKFFWFCCFLTHWVHLVLAACTLVLGYLLKMHPLSWASSIKKTGILSSSSHQLSINLQFKVKQHEFLAIYAQIFV